MIAFPSIVELKNNIGIKLERLASYRYPSIVTRYTYDHRAPLDSA